MKLGAARCRRRCLAAGGRRQGRAGRGGERPRACRNISAKASRLDFVLDVGLRSSRATVTKFMYSRVKVGRLVRRPKAEIEPPR